MYALLPMKEHSERIPEKNYKLLNNKAFFFYIADTLKAAGLFSKLVIDTDSEKIEYLAKKRFGEWVVIIERAKELSGDYVPMNKIIEYDINVLGVDNDFFQTHSTNPFLTIHTVRQAVKIYFDGKSSKCIDSVFSANTIKTRLYDKNLVPINHSPTELVRTQDLEMIYEENSSFYIFSGEAFQKNKHRIGSKPQVYPMNRSDIETLDVDDPSDWKLAEKLLRANVNDI